MSRRTTYIRQTYPPVDDDEHTMRTSPINEIINNTKWSIILNQSLLIIGPAMAFAVSADPLYKRVGGYHGTKKASL
jgi:hypothetical protein